MWFDLKGDERLGRCASEGCGGQPTSRLEAGGVGSNYCSGCREQIEGRYHWTIWQGGIAVASGSGDDAEAVCSEMVRYAAQYVQDGPIKITGSPELKPPGPARTAPVRTGVEP